MRYMIGADVFSAYGGRRSPRLQRAPVWLGSCISCSDGRRKLLGATSLTSSASGKSVAGACLEWRDMREEEEERRHGRGCSAGPHNFLRDSKFSK